MDKLTQKDLVDIFSGKTVCIVGSAPSALQNEGNHIDSYDYVIRVNNYKVKGIDDFRKTPYDFIKQVGTRTDYHYSFYGGSIRKSAEQLKADNIKGHLCKCPNDICHVTEWHVKNKLENGGDFRPIYRRRENFWIAPVYIPEKDHYMKLFDLLGGHVPSTGFACIWEIIQCDPGKLYITGFDFMTSGLHNVNEGWRPGSQDDPVRHVWETEADLLKSWAYKNKNIRLDAHLVNMFYGGKIKGI